MQRLTHGRQFVNERLLRLRAWPVQQDDNRSETADTGTCTDDLKRSVIGNVNRRQRDMGTGDNGDTAVVDPRAVSCMRSRMIDDIVKQRHISNGEQRNQHLARFPLDRADQQRGDEW